MLLPLSTLNHCDEIAFVTSKVILTDGLVSVVLVYDADSLYIKTTSVSESELKVKPNFVSMSRIWQLSRDNPEYADISQFVIYLLSKLFYDNFSKKCPKCDQNITNNVVQHLILECNRVQDLRYALWQSIYRLVGSCVYRQFISQPPSTQLLGLFNGLEMLLEHDTDVKECLKVCVTAINSMYNV